MSQIYFENIIPHLKETFSGISVDCNPEFTCMTVRNLNRHFNFTITDTHVNPEDHFSFVKLVANLPEKLTVGLSYDQIIQFITIMNHNYRGCHWALDSMSEHNEIYIYASVVSDLGQTTGDKDQLVMEILNLQKIFFMTEQHLISLQAHPHWLIDFKQKFEKTVIPCLAPENYISVEKSKLYVCFLEYVLKLNHKIESFNSNTFKITNDKQQVSLITFLGEELISIYSVISEDYRQTEQLKSILNELNQNLLLGHLEPSPISHLVGFSHFLRLTDELSDIKIRLFLDSAEIGKITYLENSYNRAA